MKVRIQHSVNIKLDYNITTYKLLQVKVRLQHSVYTKLNYNLTTYKLLQVKVRIQQSVYIKHRIINDRMENSIKGSQIGYNLR